MLILEFVDLQGSMDGLQGILEPLIIVNHAGGWGRCMCVCVFWEEGLQLIFKGRPKLMKFISLLNKI